MATDRHNDESRSLIVDTHIRYNPIGHEDGCNDSKYGEDKNDENA